MIFYVVLFFIEIYFLIEVGARIGFLGMVVWILLTFFIGLKLLEYTPISFLKSIEKLSNDELMIEDVNTISTLYTLGAILLIVPGIFTDFIGIIAIIYTLFLQFGGKISFAKDKSNSKNFKTQGDDNVIDVEVVESNTHNNNTKS